MDLHTALSNIHRDPFWWRKVLLGGALSCTIFGLPWASGFVIESMDNARRGWPTPLPLWRDWLNRYIIGFLALLIDFVFFLLPVIGIGLVIFCALLGITLGGGTIQTNILAGVILLVVFGYQAVIFALGISPVGRLILIRNGGIEEALSRQVIREALSPVTSNGYWQARWRSLPAYLPALLFAVATWLMLQQSSTFAFPVAAVLVWLTLSAVFYAHLVVAQLYAAVERAIGYS